eukprot:ctg_5670.g579
MVKRNPENTPVEASRIRVCNARISPGSWRGCRTSACPRNAGDLVACQDLLHNGLPRNSILAVNAWGWRRHFCVRLAHVLANCALAPVFQFLAAAAAHPDGAHRKSANPSISAWHGKLLTNTPAVRARNTSTRWSSGAVRPHRRRVPAARRAGQRQDRRGPRLSADVPPRSATGSDLAYVSAGLAVSGPGG